MAKLGEVCLINPKSCTLRDDTEVSFIPMTKVGEHGEFDASEIKNYSEVKKGFTNFQNGDILFAKITPCMENGKGAIAHNMKNGIGFGSTEFHVLRPDTDKITSEWLYYLTTWETFRKEAERNMTGSAGQKRVPKTFLENYVVNLPDIDTQKSENKILRKVDDLIFLRKQQLAKLDELVKARFMEMFGDFKNNSKNWPIVKFDELAKIDGNMTTDYEKYADYPHIGIDSIEKETGELKGYRTVKEDGVVSGKYIFTPQHIIYSKIRPNLNKVALPDFEGLCSADAYPILPNPKNCNRIFLALAMRSDYFLDYILQFSARTNLPKVNRKEIAGFSMPLPPLSLQNDFATFVERVDQQKQTVQQSLEKLELMKKALMQEYFG